MVATSFPPPFWVSIQTRSCHIQCPASSMSPNLPVCVAPRCDARSELVCTDQFTELIIFSEYTWIGSEEENPSEKPLSFPVRVLRAVVPSLEVATARPAPLAPKRIAASKPAPTRSSSRAARVSSKKTYVVRGSSESENDSSDSDPSDSENEPIMPMQQIEQNDLVADDVAKVRRCAM